MARNNMPCISFCNTGDDPEGRYLLATDITGCLTMFDVHARRIVSITKCTYCAIRNENCGCRERSYPHAVWGAIWLDRRSFSKQADIETAVGWSKMSTSKLGETWVVDTTESLDEVQDKSYRYIPGSGQSDIVPPNARIRAGLSTRPGGNVFPGEVITTTAQNLQQMMLDSLDEDEDDEAHGTNPFSPPRNEAPRPAHYDSQISERRLHHLNYYNCLAEKDLYESPTLPILQLGLRDLTLFQPNHHFATFPPIQYLGDILRQDVPPGLRVPNYHSANINAYARFNLTAYIPELGVVLVGNATGRVAVLSLAQTAVETPKEKLKESVMLRMYEMDDGTQSTAQGNVLHLLTDELSDSDEDEDDSIGDVEIPDEVENHGEDDDAELDIPEEDLEELDEAPPPNIMDVFGEGVTDDDALLEQEAMLMDSEDDSDDEPDPLFAEPAATTPTIEKVLPTRFLSATDTLYAMRIDHILPFASQERRGQRVEHLLVGLAVGPVQGMLGRKRGDVGRWRVMLTYEDHSVLVYEIGRAESGGGMVSGAGGGRRRGAGIGVI